MAQIRVLIDEKFTNGLIKNSYELANKTINLEILFLLSTVLAHLLYDEFLVYGSVTDTKTFDYLSACSNEYEYFTYICEEVIIASQIFKKYNAQDKITVLFSEKSVEVAGLASELLQEMVTSGAGICDMDEISILADNIVKGRYLVSIEDKEKSAEIHVFAEVDLETISENGDENVDSGDSGFSSESNDYQLDDAMCRINALDLWDEQ